MAAAQTAIPLQAVAYYPLMAAAAEAAAMVRRALVLPVAAPWQLAAAVVKVLRARPLPLPHYQIHLYRPGILEECRIIWPAPVAAAVALQGMATMVQAALGLMGFIFKRQPL